jgi:hypothetical protein
MKAYVVFPITVLAICARPSIGASEYPTRKPGLWETTMQGESFPGGRRSSLCVDAAFEASNNATTEAYMKSSCSKFDTRKEGNTWIIDSACTLGGIHTVTHQVTNMISVDAYHTDGTSTYDPPLQGKSKAVMTIDGKWMGACKPGQTPGVSETRR